MTMPKLKTHHWAGMTASMKNLFGTFPVQCYGWPKNILHMKGIENSILDLNATIRPSLAIVDAVTAMEGDGPIMGNPRHVGFIAMGSDIVSVDATCARVIGLNPVKMGYLNTGWQVPRKPGCSAHSAARRACVPLCDDVLHARPLEDLPSEIT